MSTRTPTEPEMIRAAKERLAAAEEGVKKSAFLPAGNEIRDAAVQELHAAKAIAEEWAA